MDKIVKMIDNFFKEEDRIISKAMDKLSYLIISRNISQEKERNELEKAREDFKDKIRNRSKI